MTSYAITCKKCKKLTSESFRSESKAHTTVKLKCGHFIFTVKPKIEPNALDELTNLKNHKLYEYQKTGYKFAAAANFRVLFADEMGVGKTIEALTCLKLNPELLPAIILVKSAVKMQWAIETYSWTGMIPQIIESSSDTPHPAFKIYIVSLDMLRRMNGLFDKINLKTLIIDECHLIKNTDASRAQEVNKLSKRVPYVIGLSGTPIKNNAIEYFSMLNILRPETFYSKASFISNWLDTYTDRYTGRVKYGGLRDTDYFHSKTKDFIIRRTRAEVLPDLPQITRNYTYSDLGDEVATAYNEMMQQFNDIYEQAESGGWSSEDYSNILAVMARLRHLTGISKIKPVFDQVQEFIEQTDRKLVVFVHHHAVMNTLKVKLDAFLKQLGLPECLTLDPQTQSADSRYDIIEKFKLPENRILLASTLASGESYNIQFCSDCIMAEREWNPANEEQAEGRFIRIGQLADKVTATYAVAIGTIDEYFANLVEQKREIFAKTMGDEFTKWDETAVIKDLARILYEQGKKKWSIK